jgi:hypothetical protein
MPQPSPYTPGVVSKDVPGRVAQLGFYRERAEYIGVLGNFSGRITVYHAARGIGKTSLLRGAQRIFRARSLKTIWITANEDENLLSTVLTELKSVSPKGSKGWQKVSEALDTITVSVGTSGTGVKATLKPNTDSSSKAKLLQVALAAAVTEVRESGSNGLVILIDEIQSADQQSLRAIAHAWQELSALDDPLPLGLFAVGLPGSQEYINKAVTFSERYDFRPLPDLDDSGVAMALVEPAAAAGVSWSIDALREAVAKAQRYPYKVQLIGEEAWRSASYPDQGYVFTRHDIRKSLPEVDRQMRGLFAARWRSASKKQRELISAIASLGGENVKREQVAEKLGVRTAAISVPRDRLLRNGVIEATDRGLMSFTVPGFTEYVLGLSEH